MTRPQAIIEERPPIVSRSIVSRNRRTLMVAWLVAGLPALLAASLVETPIVDIDPGRQIQEVVNSHPAGTTFRLKSGVHRMQTIYPRDGDVFMGESGTVLSGARRLTNFVPSGRLWVATGQSQEGVRRDGLCQTAFPRCAFPEELFINGERLRQVGSLEEVGPPAWGPSPGQWFFDYAADAIYISYDPTWLTVETSVTPMAFAPSGDNVTVTGMTIEMYAAPAQFGAIHAQGRSGWIVSNNEVRKNHGAGIRVGSRAQVLRNYVHNNGQLGIFGMGDDILVEGNAIFANNIAGYFQRWEGGGAKFVITRNLVVRNNFVHKNDGPGLWSDIDSIDTLFEHNTSQDNTLMGIFHEISYRAVIRYNVVKRNGFGYPDWIAGAGILVAGSPDVEIYGNLVEGNADGIGAIQQNRGWGAYGPHELNNLWVHDNLLVNNGGWTGIAQDIGDRSYFTSRNNRFTGNRYQFGPGLYHFQWMDGERQPSEWTQDGNDPDGAFN